MISAFIVFCGEWFAKLGFNGQFSIKRDRNGEWQIFNFCNTFT